MQAHPRRTSRYRPDQSLLLQLRIEGTAKEYCRYQDAADSQTGFSSEASWGLEARALEYSSPRRWSKRISRDWRWFQWGGGGAEKYEWECPRYRCKPSQQLPCSQTSRTLFPRHTSISPGAPACTRASHSAVHIDLWSQDTPSLQGLLP